MLIIDSKMRNIEKEKLKLLGYELFEISPNPNLYFEISSHVDIHCTKINNYIIGDKSLNYANIIYGNSILANKYPLDIPYNICIIGNFAIHNFKYTDSKILEILEKENFIKLNINQGYSKCSIAVIDNNSVIVTDKAIAQILKEYDFDVLLLPENITQNIHLYKNSNLEYSTMHGFIGGCISRIDDYIFISGDLNKIDFDNKIKNYIENKNLKIIDFPNLDIVDYGGILKI